MTKSIIQKPKKGVRKFRLIIVFIIFVVVVMGGYIAYRKLSQSSTQSTSVTNSKIPSVGANNNVSSNNTKANPQISSTSDNSSSVTATSNSPQTPNSFSVKIVNSIVSSGNLHVGTIVTGISSGACTLTATQTGQATLNLGNSLVHQDVNTYDCGVYNISTTKFPTPGVWLIKLTITNNGNYSSDTANVNI